MAHRRRPLGAGLAAIKLAYVHNLGDVLLSLGPVLAGILILITGRSLFDPRARVRAGRRHRCDDGP